MEEHKGFCIKTILNKPFPVEIETKQDFNFGDALESVYPLLDIIFGYLSDEDLENVAKIKMSWKEVADRALKKRSKLCWFTCFQKHKSNFLKHSGNLHHNNASIGIILFDYRRLKLNKYICLHKDTDNLEKMTFADYLCKEIVNSKVNYCLLSCPKVVSFFGCDMYYPNGSMFDGILLPQIPGIKTTMFYCNPLKLKKTPSMIETYIKSNDEIMCLLLFSLTDLHRSMDNLFKILLQDSKQEDIAVGGGIIRGSKSFQNVQKFSKKVINTNDIFCIAFSREKNTNPKFSAASFVINGNDFSNQEFFEEVLKFKKRVIIRKNSVGFRICCGAKWEKDEESIIFSKHFPNTPLLGLEADGEIGWDCFNLPDDEESPESKPKKSKLNCPKNHEWSTVFVIITWGDIVKET
ncbi:hypothetical protein HHI36_018187 [Cryptolaemus montrouzieri]|uniref:F-box domain-containing protein n=1 Tax=Cryptolaemus montrouzieri TaxID=559131 RepID=A0ABD2NZ67_9CUCU